MPGVCTLNANNMRMTTKPQCMVHVLTAAVVLLVLLAVTSRVAIVIQSPPRQQHHDGVTWFSSSSLLRPSSSRQLQLEEENDDEDGEGWVYSKYATIVPDPEYQAPDEDTVEAWANEWGAWHFWDGTEEVRPAGDYCAPYPFRDVPAEDFDDESWQADAVFVNHVLDSGEELVRRAQDAIYVEYGHARNLPVHELFERNKMFKWEKIDTTNVDGKPVQPTPDALDQGGWTTSRSVSNLARRLLHAIMTNDEFVVVVVGGPAAAAPGNHFRQSYAMQLHRVVAPVLARLGVKLVTRNLSHRHASSLPAAMAQTWGTDTKRGVDVLIWDEGPWERTRREKDLFLRQALLSSSIHTEKVPMVLMGGTESDWELLRMYHEKADIDIGRFGTALYGVNLTTSMEMVKTLPHASQYLHCDATTMGVCRQAPDEYCAECWIPRNDIPDPKALFPNLADKVPDQRNWNPGWRRHQLTGRLLAYTLLDALQDALQTFTTGTGGGPPLDGEGKLVDDSYGWIVPLKRFSHKRSCFECRLAHG